MAGRKYTAQEMAYLKEHYANTPSQEIAVALGRSIESVYNISKKLGVRKSKEYLATLPKSGFVNSSKGHQYPKGHVPHNKGTKMPSDIYEKVQKTMFKKGHTPKNTKVEGALAIRNDKSGRPYLYVKIENNYWELYHRELWRKFHGEIPEAHNIIFKDGNTANLTIENLEMVSNAELMKRNSYINYGEELRQLITAKACITKEINKIEREAL